MSDKDPILTPAPAVAQPATVQVPLPPGITAEQMMAMFGTLFQGLSKSITDGIAEARPQKVTIGRFKATTPFHDDLRKMKRLTRPTYQNGSRLNAAQLFPEEIAAFNKLTRSGRYLNRLIEVIVRQDGSDEVVELRYKNRTADDMLVHRSSYRDLRDMLRQIVIEHDEKLAEEGLLREQRKAFNAAPTRLARAKADARDNAENQSLEP